MKTMAVNPFTLSLQAIVDVVVYVTPTAAARQTFNQGLIIGSTTGVIPSYGSNSRVRVYTSVAGMLNDGFTNASPEVVAAQLYFDQSPAPVYVWIGFMDPTGIKTFAVHSGGGGTNYVVGDTFVVTQGSASNSLGRVATVSSGGVVTSVILLQGGTGYTTGTALATTTNSAAGSGLTIDISAIGETPLMAIQACRAVNWDWYAAVVLGSTNTDHTAIAGWIESAQPSSIYFYGTSDAQVKAGSASSIAGTLMAEGYSRTACFYSAFNANIASAAMGRIMGLNTGLANSAWTAMFKNLVGCLTDNLNVDDVVAMCGEADGSSSGINVNVYVNYANYYNWLQKGVMSNGYFIDQVVNRDMLVNNIQLSVADLFNQMVKVPQTDPGESMLVHVINQACQQATVIGYLATGTWTGPNVLNLNTGDLLQNGYLTQTIPVSQQSIADRDVRKSTPMYVAIKEAGAIQSLLIAVYVNP
jgi:hypothetical protein